MDTIRSGTNADRVQIRRIASHRIRIRFKAGTRSLAPGLTNPVLPDRPDVALMRLT